MKISKIIISNFGSFGPTPQEIDFKQLTAFIGANGTGKSVALIALCRVFGANSSERTVLPGDFHLSPNEKLEDLNERKLSIDIFLEFPELKNEIDFMNNIAVPEFFQHMIVEDAGGVPYCHARLESVWRNTGQIEGDVETSIYWITSTTIPIPEEHKRRMSSHHRAKILVHYVPASRDPHRQIRQSSGTIMHQLIQAVEWSEELKCKIEKSAKSIQSNFVKQKGIKAIQKSLSEEWNTLYSGTFHSEVSLRPLGQDLRDLLKNIELVFAPGLGATEEKLDKLSDGSKSLFYLALVQSLMKIEDSVIKGTKATKGIDTSKLSLPALTIVALEEPENHLSPHYLARIVGGCRRICESERCQVILTSHAPGLLKRILPEEVRYFRLTTQKDSKVKALTMPKNDDDAHKYVCNAVKAYPELYFSEYVVLGEGMSEEVILPRILDAHELPADESLISIVPLGGRHVNHLWKLLNDLDIPHSTLLDYDWGREGGGWGRIKYACQQLLALGVERKKILTVGNNPSRILSDSELADMHTWQSDDNTEEGWIKMLEKYSIFFSSHIDIDWIMLDAFPKTYKALAPTNGGPNIPVSITEKNHKSVFAAVTKKKVSQIQSVPNWADAEQLYWYRYLFLGRGKPNTHIRALAEISNSSLKRHCPSVLTRLAVQLKRNFDVRSV